MSTDGQTNRYRHSTGHAEQYRGVNGWFSHRMGESQNAVLSDGHQTPELMLYQVLGKMNV